MSQFGAMLREAREQRGLSLGQIEAMTRIRRVFLEAMEEERLGELPPPAYAVGLLRNYGQFLGLDVDPLVADYRAAVGKPGPVALPPVLDRPLVHARPRSAWGRVLRSFLLVCLIALAGWYLYTRLYLGRPWMPQLEPPTWWPEGLWFPLSVTPPVWPRPAQQHGETGQAITAAPGLSATPTAASAGAESGATASPTMATATPEAPTPTPATRGQSTSTARPQTATRAGTAPATATGLHGVVATASPTSGRTVVVGAGVRVFVRAVAETYVLVTADGQRIYESILGEGNERVWAAERVIVLRVGNAAGLQVTVNDVPVGSLGRSGQVVTVQYSADSLPGPQ